MRINCFFPSLPFLISLIQRFHKNVLHMIMPQSEKRAINKVVANKNKKITSPEPQNTFGPFDANGTADLGGFLNHSCLFQQSSNPIKLLLDRVLL